MNLYASGLVPVGDISDHATGNINPDPIIMEETDFMANDYLSASKLQEITGREDLENVKMVDLVVDTTETTLGNFGNFLPSLKQLKLSNSVIPSVRDVGTSLSHIKILWMSCCGLHDIDGIASMISLNELYLAYNEVTDISPVSFLDNLQVLDLEGNLLKEQEQLDYLSILSKLKTLTLSGNPLCQILDKKASAELEAITSQTDLSNNSSLLGYRETVVKKIPHLEYLDDEKCSNIESHSQSSSEWQVSLAASSHSQEDIDLITNAIREGLIAGEDTNMPNGEEVDSVRPKTPAGMRPGSAGLRRPMSALSRFTTDQPVRSIRSTPLSRPMTALTPGRSGSAGAMRAETLLQRVANVQRPSSTGSDDITLQDESSILTFGDVICGNPLRALRSRKTSPMPVISILKSGQSGPVPPTAMRPATAATFRKSSPVEPTPPSDIWQSKNDVFQELKEWRVKHEERITGLSPDVQILKLEGNSSAEEVLLDSDQGTDSDADEILDLDTIPGIQDDNNNIDLKMPMEQKLTTAAVNEHQPVVAQDITRLKSRMGQCRAQVRSPPPKNLSPSSMSSSLSPRNSPVSPRSPLFSSSQLEVATVPIMRGSPRKSPNSNNLQSKVISKHMPTPPKVGTPRPKTAADFRNVHLRRSMAGSSHKGFVTLSSPMSIPQAVPPNKRQPSSQVKP